MPTFATSSDRANLWRRLAGWSLIGAALLGLCSCSQGTLYDPDVDNDTGEVAADPESDTRSDVSTDIRPDASCVAGLRQPCGTAVGACHKGSRECEGGRWSECRGAKSPSDETCDGRDNDCDGTIDEDCSCSGGDTQTCGQSRGICTTGTQTCQGGTWGACKGKTTGSDEACNGKDDDCDGETDERVCGPGDSCDSDIACKDGPCVDGVCGGDYEWETGDWGDCSRPCGGGTQTRSVECVDAATGQSASESDCSGSKPDEQRDCNPDSCWFLVERHYASSGSDKGNHDIAYPAESPSGPYSPGSNYKVEGNWFKASTHKLSGFIALYHCRNGQDTFVAHDPGCEGETATHDAPIGYLSRDETSRFDTPVHRCYIPPPDSVLANGDHFVSQDPDCEVSRAELEWTLGYFDQ